MALIVERENEMQLSLCEVSVYGEPHLGSPCWSNPCGNGGSCKPDGCYYTCVCPKSWSGTNCEGKNWAYHAVTTLMQKVSTEIPEVVGNTVDGNREDMMRHGNDNLCSASTLITDPWYLVGVSTLIELRQMLLVNRQDCCSLYMNKFDVLIFDDKLCGARRHNMSGVVWKINWCVPVPIGRIVKITFYGLHVISLCEVEIYGVPVPCRNNPCNNGKTCRRIGNTNSHECLCLPGFNGSNCTEAIPCWSNPCHNGGSCRNIEMSNVYQCFCPGNTTGSNCEDFKPCWSNPCDNGGTCTENEASYTCKCSSKWTGTYCRLVKDLTIEQNEVNKTTVEQHEVRGMSMTTKVLICMGVGTGVVVAGGGLAACGACPTQSDIVSKMGAAVAMKSIKSTVQGSTELGDDDEEDDEEEEELSMWDYIVGSYLSL